MLWPSDGFEGDIYLLFRLLLPGVVKRVYHMHSKQLVKIFSQVSSLRLRSCWYVRHRVASVFDIVSNGELRNPSSAQNLRHIVWFRDNFI